MKCRNCGAENQEGAKFCSSCGSKLEEEVLETQEVKVEPGQVKCRICGHINTTEDTYCKLCGSQLSPQDKAQTYNTTYNTSYNNTQNQIYANTGNSTPGMVVGIVSAACSITCCLFLVGLIAGIVGIFMNIKPLSKNYPDKGKAVAGLILSIVGLVIGLYLLFSIIVALNDPETMEQIRQAIQEAQNQAQSQQGFFIF